MIVKTAVFDANRASPPRLFDSLTEAMEYRDRKRREDGGDWQMAFVKEEKE